MQKQQRTLQEHVKEHQMVKATSDPTLQYASLFSLHKIPDFQIKCPGGSAQAWMIDEEGRGRQLTVIEDPAASESLFEAYQSSAASRRTRITSPFEKNHPGEVNEVSYNTFPAQKIIKRTHHPHVMCLPGCQEPIYSENLEYVASCD